jgi:cytochrome c-type biogenesis protein CcmH
MKRREFLGSVAAGVVMFVPTFQQSTIPTPPQDTTGPSGRLYDPTWAGPSIQPVTARDNDKAIQAIEKRLKCTCGCGLDVYTCRTTDFTCPVSPKMHAQVLALADAGSSADQIIAEFVREHGLEILMAPPKTGFNLVGYFTPGALVLAVGTLLVVAMLGWIRRARPSPTLVDAADAASPAELERLRDALQRTEA